MIYSYYYAKKIHNSGNNTNVLSEASKWIDIVFHIENYSRNEENIDDSFNFDASFWGFCSPFLIVFARINCIICGITNIIQI